MAIVTRPGSELPCVKLKYCSGYGASGSVSNVMTLKSIWSSIQIQLCSLALAGSLFNVVRLPRDAFRYGPVPYLLAFTASSVLVALPVALLELAVGQLTQQDAIGVWRAVPILRGVGHLKLITSGLCCVYYMLHVALAAAYLIWIGKGSFPLRECTRLQMTLDGYEDRMNASECFNTTFMAPFGEYPQYLGIIAIIIFVLWFFIPLFLYRLYKSMKATFAVCAPATFILGAILAVAVGDSRWLSVMLPRVEQWRELMQPRLWHGALAQALLSAQIKSGYLIRCGGSVYRKSDVRWTAVTIILENIVAGWIWVLFWEGTGGGGTEDTSFIAILVLIYQSAVNERRAKQWPLLALAIVFLSGIITMITLLYPIFDRLQRMAGDRWRLVACLGSALGTALTIAILSRGQNILQLLDEMAVPFLVMFTTSLEVIAFCFIYGSSSLLGDIEFLLGSRICYYWLVGWWTTPFILLGVTGWWLRSLLRATWLQPNLSLWPLLGVFLVSLFIIVIFAAIAVAKEEQYNLISKFIAAFRPSRLWGPEDPMIRYQWMSQRRNSEYQISEEEGTVSEIYPHTIMKSNESAFKKDWIVNNFMCQRPYYTNPGFEFDYQPPIPEERLQNSTSTYNTYTINGPKNDFKVMENCKYVANLPTLSNNINSGDNDYNCTCNRHFSLRVPHYKNGELTTNL